MKKKAKRKVNKKEIKLKPAKTKAKAKPKTSRAKKRVKKEDLNKPKKPPTAFFYFLEDFRKGYQEEHPEVKSMRDIGKACGEKWKTMTFEEKVQYYDTATEKRQEFEEATAAYVKRKESGEDLKVSDDDYGSEDVME
ncbi:HMG-box (high mobility group) DNA-binding family protein [Tasmannia lanceolata]|uniref:HMG-box (high mobility group) DNA-binding family protein n=1 Tax=Tasmannia lanceolata TaxID=3420 RepID=UPI0040648FCE